MTAIEKLDWQQICDIHDLVPNSGVCALIGNEQIAIFYLPEEDQSVYALHNLDPIGGVHVLSRGIVGDIKGKLVVASPLYKQHYCLSSGACLEDDEVHVAAYDVKIDGDTVLIRA